MNGPGVGVPVIVYRSHGEAWSQVYMVGQDRGPPTCHHCKDREEGIRYFQERFFFNDFVIPKGAYIED